MKKTAGTGTSKWGKLIAIFISLLTVAGVSGLSMKDDNASIDRKKAAVKPPNKDSIISAKAFLGAYQVLMHSACMNCHPAGDVPLQGNDSHLHTMGVQRGVDGKGIYALKCANCHQATNLPGPHMPPGHPNWHLPPANMKMVFQGKTPRQLAKQLLDPKLNGGKTKADLIIHASEDKLVAGSWNHGEGHAAPPISHAEFARLVKLWIDKGAYLPPANIPALH
jgi:mono/diheme cytochrome c family protein